MSNAPSVTVPARSSFNLHGYGSATFTYPVADTGNTRITVSGRTASVSPLARKHPAQSWVTSVKPATLHLRPHQSGAFTITVKVPAGVHAGASGWVNIIARAAPETHAGTASEAAAVGGSLHLTHAGHKLHPLPPAPVTHGGPGVLGVILLATLGAILALALAGYFIRRQHHHPREERTA